MIDLTLWNLETASPASSFSTLSGLAAARCIITIMATTVVSSHPGTVLRLDVGKLNLPYDHSPTEALWLSLFYRWWAWRPKSLRHCPRAPSWWVAGLGLELSLTILLHCFIYLSGEPIQSFWSLASSGNGSRCLTVTHITSPSATCLGVPLVRTSHASPWVKLWCANSM